MVTTTRAALLGDRDACIAATESILGRGLRDPEALYFCVRNLARVGETEQATTLLVRVVGAGFHNPGTFRRDPWLAPIRGHPLFEPLVREAEIGRRASVAAYRAAGGESLLGAAE
jgi:hypothetical protein